MISIRLLMSGGSNPSSHFFILGLPTHPFRFVRPHRGTRPCYGKSTALCSGPRPRWLLWGDKSRPGGGQGSYRQEADL
jgi:hypothetical protein